MVARGGWKRGVDALQVHSKTVNPVFTGGRRFYLWRIYSVRVSDMRRYYNFRVVIFVNATQMVVDHPGQNGAILCVTGKRASPSIDRPGAIVRTQVSGPGSRLRSHGWVRRGSLALQ